MIRNTDTKNVLLFLASALASFLGILTLVRYIFDRLIDQCCKLQAQAIEEFHPDVIVGTYTSYFLIWYTVSASIQSVYRIPYLLIDFAEI